MDGMKQKDEAALLAKLSAMHDQFCACTGAHPDELLLTPESAAVLGWEDGDSTPFYAVVRVTTALQDIFTTTQHPTK